MEALKRNKLSILGLLFFVISCEKEQKNQIILKNNINPENTIHFIYHPNGIEEILTTVDVNFPKNVSI